jgi:hypothetical protein
MLLSDEPLNTEKQNASIMISIGFLEAVDINRGLMVQSYEIVSEKRRK